MVWLESFLRVTCHTYKNRPMDDTGKAKALKLSNHGESVNA